MRSDWNEQLLEDCMDAIIDYRGKTPKKTDCGIPLITAKIIKKGRVLPVSEYIADEDYNDWMRRGIPLTGDVVLTTEAPLGEVAQLDGRKIALAQRVITLRGKENFLDNTFLKYLLMSHDVQHQLDGRGTGTTVKGIKQSELRKVMLTFPKLCEQKAIAHVLGALDDRIELNRRLNETLEAMAQALFKSWFVDFDPVIDNALDSGKEIPAEFSDRAAARAALGDKRRPLPAEIRTLFPDEFIDSIELGWIPKGWKVEPLGNITTELRRGISPKYTEEEGVRVVNQRCIRNHEVDFSLARRNDVTQRKVEGRFLEEGDLLINSTGVGTLGRMAQVHSLSEPTVVDSHVTIARADRAKYMPYTFARMMLSLGPYVEAMGEGSTGQTELSRKNLAEVQVIVPPQEIQKFAEKYFYDFTEKASFNSQSTGVLRVTRDTLLPKLLSGELRIPDAEKMVEELPL